MSQEQHYSTESRFHGAAVIDQNGIEIPITEAMIARACRELEQHDAGLGRTGPTGVPLLS